MSTPATTPYDNKVAIWHWKGDSLAERTIEDVVRSIKQFAPHATQVFVKTTDGVDWMSRFDTRTDTRIDGPAAIKRWVQVLEANGMEFHAWCVVKGQDVNKEADLLIQTGQVAGVRSIIMDVEPYKGFWQVGRDPIRPFMTRIRRGLGGRFHIAMSMDPRRQHYNSIFPAEWKPFVNSLLPQVYWNVFERPIGEVMDEAYEVWGREGLPIYPVLSGNAPVAEIETARAYVIQKKGAKGLSYWRLGVIDAAQFAAINKPMSQLPNPDPIPNPQGGRYGREIIITPTDPRFTAGSHVPGVQLTTFKGTWGWDSRYIVTQKQRSQVWGRWVPQITESGRYEVSVFIPARHASTANARYRLHGVKGVTGEMTLPVPQTNYFNLWVSLGVFDFDANNAQAGIVFLNDLTGEEGKDIAFDAVRYRQIINNPNDSRYLADGYDAPMGTAAERASDAVWPGHWIDATGYAVRYFKGTPSEAYHTGADLNLNRPYFDADKDAPIYAAASGTVTFCAKQTGWGLVIVIRHDPLITTGQVLYGRYAHGNEPRVKPGDRVVRGQQIANIGNADGNFAYHLHFDLSHTTILERTPSDWPKLNLNRVLANYIDPREFIEKNRPQLR